MTQMFNWCSFSLVQYKQKKQLNSNSSVLGTFYEIPKLQLIGKDEIAS